MSIENSKLAIYGWEITEFCDVGIYTTSTMTSKFYCAIETADKFYIVFVHK
jgi:hypothetical protein